MCELPPIDSGYTGEIHAIISNVGNTVYKIKADDKIGQLMILPIVIPDFTYDYGKNVELEHLVPLGDKEKENVI